MKEVVVNLDFDFSDPCNTPQNFSEFSLDIETTGLDPNQGYRIRCIQVYIPALDKVAFIDLWQATQDQLDWIELLFEKFKDTNSRWYLQNAMFDLYWFYSYFQVIPRGQIIDSMLLSQLLKAGLTAGFKQKGIDSPNSLKRLAIEHCYDHDKTEQQSDWAQVELTQEQISYACRDPIVTYHIGDRLYADCAIMMPDCTEAILGSIRPFVLLQYSGIPGDYNQLCKIQMDFSFTLEAETAKLVSLLPVDPIHHKNKVLPRIKELTELAASGKKTRKSPIADKPFNINSAKQLQDYMINDLGISKELMLKDKAEDEDDLTAAKNKLFEIVSMPEYSHLGILLDIARVKSLKKALSTIESYIKHYDHKRRCVRSTYNILAIQGTGRSSSGNRELGVNCQNVSNYLPSHEFYKLPAIRSFCIPDSDELMAEFDIDASHFQLARYFSQDEKMMESYFSGVKIHYYTMASILATEGKFYKPEDCVKLVAGEIDPGNQGYYKKLYKLCKNVIYSFLNFSGARTLQSTYFKAETLVDLEECRKYLDACAEQFSGLREYQLRHYREALETKRSIYTEDGIYLGQYVLIVPNDGRLIYIKCSQARQKWDGSVELTPKISDIVAPRWLSPEGTLMERTLAAVADYQLDNPGKFRLVNFSHDSFAIFVKRKHADEILPFCYDNLNSNVRMFVKDYQPENPDPASCLKKIGWHK